jgi:Ca2+-binding EF-hand superfamily protein
LQAIDKIKARIQTLYREFDGEVHDGLDKDAVGKVMARLKTEQYRDSNPPTPEAVEWIMRSSDVSGTGKLRLKELEHAIHVYSGYLRHKAHIDDVFERFDADGDGQLDRDELRAYVRADLNDGVDPDRGGPRRDHRQVRRGGTGVGGGRRENRTLGDRRRQGRVVLRDGRGGEEAEPLLGVVDAVRVGRRRREEGSPERKGAPGGGEAVPKRGVLRRVRRAVTAAKRCDV